MCGSFCTLEKGVAQLERLGERYEILPVFSENAYATDTLATGIDDLAQYAQSKGLTYAQLKDANPWLRGTSLMNKSRRTYILKLPTQAAMHYDPQQTVPHHPEWVID